MAILALSIAVALVAINQIIFAFRLAELQQQLQQQQQQSELPQKEQFE